MLGGLQEARDMPGHAPRMDKMFYTGWDQLPAMLDEPEMCLKQVGSHTQKVGWEQRGQCMIYLWYGFSPGRWLFVSFPFAFAEAVA